MKLVYACVAMFVIGTLWSCKQSPERNPIDQLVTVYSLNPADSLRLACALFLRDNMKTQLSEKAQFFHNGSPIEIRMDTMTESELMSLISDTNLKYETFFLPDTTCVSKELLTKNIEAGIRIWNRYPWSKHVPRDVFLNYLLPYKVINEYPENWRSYFTSKYKDSVDTQLRRFLKNPIAGYDDPNDLYYRIIVNESGKWYKYANEFTKLTQSPSFSELLCIGKGNCFETSILNVYILRSLGIPATVDIIPVWGSKNGSHASEVFWNGKDKMRVASGREFYRPAKVFRLSFAKQNKWTDTLKPFLKNSEFLLPFLKNDHWIDVTDLHTNTASIHVPVQAPGLSRFAYICVYSYGKWQPVFWGKITNGFAEFQNMGCSMLYQVALPVANGYVLTGKILMLDKEGNISYPKTSYFNTASVELHKTDNGKLSYVQKGHEYALLAWNNSWQKIGTAKCRRDSILYFKTVPQHTLLRINDLTAKNDNERIFTITGSQLEWW